MLKIHVHYDPARKQFLELLFSYAPLFAERGVSFVDRGTDFVWSGGDAFIVQHHWAYGAIESGKPTIVAERTDSAVLVNRRGLERDCVKAIWKLNVADEWVQKEGYDRWHVKTINSARTPTLPKLKNGVFEKIVLAPCYHALDEIDVFAALRDYTAKPRQKIAHFRGRMSYDKCEEITKHRLAAFYQTKKVPNSTTVRTRVCESTYLAELLDSHIVVSPWGFGETCWRDAEAMYAGCVLVKPNTDYVQTWPAYFKANETYVPCDVMFNDLPEVCESIMDNWKNYKDMREQNRERLLKSIEPQAIVDQMMVAIERLM